MAALFDDDDDELAWQTDDEISDSELHEDDTPVLQLTGRMGPPRPYRGQVSPQSPDGNPSFLLLRQYR